MDYKRFEDWSPSPASLETVLNADTLIREYSAQGYTLTLRQLFYAFVSRNMIPNTERSYKNLSKVITRGRMAGMLPWNGIEDRNRGAHLPWSCESERRILDSVPYQFRMDFWARQDTYVEVWVEKEALGNVISKACDPLHVPHMSCKGYLSASEAYAAGRRFRRYREDHNKRVVVIHLGDHDPSGLDMTRDNRERSMLFSEGRVDLVRIALNHDQVEAYDPPPNPTKVTDPRADEYLHRYGSTCWELDALTPDVIVELIQTKVRMYIDTEVWQAVQAEQDEHRERLMKLGRHWSMVSDFLDGLGSGDHEA